MNHLLLEASTESSSMFSPLILAVVMIAVMYFLMIRPQKKRDKQVQEMRSKIEVGDEIVTIGGMIGRVVSVKEDTIVLETGSDRSKIRLMRWAVQTNTTTQEAAAAAEPVKK